MKDVESSISIDDLIRSYPSVVCIQGLGFVGAAMAVAVANTQLPNGDYPYLVIGVELDNAEGSARASALREGRLPFQTTDRRLTEALKSAVDRGNILATCDPSVYSLADITIVDVHLDVDFDGPQPSADMEPFRSAIKTLSDRMPAGSLVIVETTVPPGTTKNLILPTVQASLRQRNLPEDSISIAHSYERVMPGPHHLASIIEYWRVYAGVNQEAASKCRTFFETVIDTENFPLQEMSNPTASETAKVLENTYRAVNIALMDEWGRFAESVGVDIFEIINAVRVRPTHVNLREPGLGVGGYCLTKDPLFPQVALNEFFNAEMVDFPFASLAVSVNNEMPKRTASEIRSLFEQDLSERNILVLGASYRPDVEDTRYSPTSLLVTELIASGASVEVHDPLATSWELEAVPIKEELSQPQNFDAVVFAVAHSLYLEMDLSSWLEGYSGWVVDANHVLTDDQRLAVKADLELGVYSIGRGYE